MNLLSVAGLKKRFNLEAGFFARFGSFVYAVNGLSFSIGRNESYGLVGESGCGKTTAARLLVRMYEADEGAVTYRPGAGGPPEDVLRLKRASLKRYREKVKYVFQDPARSLNPRMTVFEALTAGYRWSDSWPGVKKAREEAAAILEETGLSAADLERRPMEFSGGQRQRISIARGLLLKPELLICDEVVSALDVSIQGQILNLLLDLRARRAAGAGLSFLFITHDLKVACYFCDRAGVMYRGMLVEEAPAADLYEKGLHPYTRLLFASASYGAAAGQAGADQAPAVQGEPGTASVAPAGCPFSARCPRKEARCLAEVPPLRELAPGRKVRCFGV
ncbi:MAG: ABC transporter ATP-binding protein [Treponema sp.]|jgi:oligopeptide/dipeptide ABC transporter ATP-binding protein|nr:ABC transporter ATP-binding protein [Treponema sp.]